MSEPLRWRRVGREHHSTDGRFEIYCAHVSRNYHGSVATWRVIDNRGPNGRRATSATSPDNAKAIAERWRATR